MSAKGQVVFRSPHGHVYRLAGAVAQGAREVPGTEVQFLQVTETLSDDVLRKIGALDASKASAHLPVADPKRLFDADAILLGSGTRFGGPTAQMRVFLDATGSHWGSGTLIGKVGSAPTSTSSQLGGQETTLTNLHYFIFHMDMVVVGVPYSVEEFVNMKEATGGSAYGASTITGAKGEHMTSENEPAIARHRGRHTTDIAARLAARR